MNKMVNGALAGLVLTGAVVPVQQVEAAQANHTLDHVDIRIHNANFTLNSITYNPDGSIANQESETKQADVTKAHAVIINYTSGGSVQLDNFSFTNQDGGEIRAMFHDNGLGKLKFGDIASVTFVVDLKAKDGSVYNNVNVTLSGQYMHDAYNRCPGWDYANKGLDFLIPASDNVSVTLEAYNVTVNYIDEATGQQIAQSYIDNVVEGHSYDVSNKDDEIVIDGYEYVRTEGNVAGSNMSGNQVVNVYYRQLENYSVTINYLDAETEEPIAESYLSELIREGGSYDVSHLDDEKVIEGFTFSHIEGDEPSGVMDENKVINVFYDRIPEEYTLTINYLDKETGEPLGEPHSQVIIEDEEYNVSHLDDEIEFDKYDYVETRGELEGIASGDVVIDVFYERKSVPMTPLTPATPIPYDITVKYVDEEGNEIHDSFIQEDVNAGTEWDVSDKDDEVEIDGYEYVETQGETSGERLDGDKEIIVVYRPLEEFELIINYLDKETGEPIGEPHQEVIIEGKGYDVSHLDDEIAFEKYDYVETEGEVIGEDVQGNVVINVYYERKSVPMTPLTPAQPILYDITIHYVDEEGNPLKDDVVLEDMKAGSHWSAEHLDNEVVFEGYTYVETQGALSGVLDGDKEITVIYRPLEEFTVTINYLDKETGEPLGDPHQEVVTEFEDYDVSHLDNEVVFDKYNYVETEGDVIGKRIEEDVVINVYYERKSVPMTPLIPAQPILYDITVRYVDEEGNELVHPQVIDDVKAGSEFDVSDLDDEVVIPGYAYVETQGETSGIVDGDKEIVVVYTKVPEPVVELFDLVVRYVDIDGNELLPSYEEQDVFTPGEFVTLDFVKDIEGYNYLTGGNVIGTVTEDIEVVVIYEKIVEEPEVEPEPQLFEIIINYLDLVTGKPIGEAHMEGILEGQSYDVSHLDNEVEFEGYDYVRTQGELVGEDVQGDVVINVYYTQEESEDPQQPVIPQEPEVDPEPQPEPEQPKEEKPAEPEKEKPEQPVQPKPEAPKGEVEFDVPQTGIDVLLYSAIATGLAGAGFAVRRKRK